MNSETTNNIKKSKNIYTFPLIFLALIILLTIGIYSYNSYYEGVNIKLDKKIAKVDKDIENINKDKNIQVYNLIEKNTKILNKFESYSQITRFIDSIAYIEKVYGLSLSGFNYSNGIVSTKAETDFTKTVTPYLSVSKFIEKYRKDEKVDFMLPFISKITGSRKIEFNLKLQVKDNLIKDNLIKNNIPNKK